MIQLKSIIKKYNIPNSWMDLTYNDYLALVKIEEPLDQVKHITKMNEFELANIDPLIIKDCLRFLYEPIDDIEPTNYINDDAILAEDIGEDTFEKKVLAVQAVRDGDVLKLIEIYSGVNVGGLDCYHVFGLLNFLTQQLEAILKRESEMLKSNVTKRQINAGINEFDKLGEFNIIDMIARNYSYTHNEVEQLPYNLVFLILLKQNISSKFEQKYNELSE